MTKNEHTDDFTCEVLERTGHTDPASVQAVARLTLGALAQHLPDGASDLQGAIPKAWLDQVPRRDGPAPTPEQVYDEAARATGVRAGVALEIVQGVLSEVSRRLTPSRRGELRVVLPEAWSDLLIDPRPRSEPRVAPHTTVMPGQGHTLATGKPAGTSLGDQETAGQTHSVAASDDPHNDTRLSSAEGPSQERRGDTLARGRPGSKHPVSTDD